MLRRQAAELNYFQLATKAKKTDFSRCRETVRLALAGDTATQHLASVLKVLMADQAIKLEVLETPFDALELQVYNANSDLYQCSPDVIAILNVTQALRTRYYQRKGSGTEFLEKESTRIVGIWDAIRAHTTAAVVQSNFSLPVERIFGNYDHKVPDSLHAVVCELNARIAQHARERSQVFLNDVEAVASFVGRRSFFDNRFWNMYKLFCALEHLPLVAENIADIVLSIRGHAVKCVVLDLDNTLWGGVIGDDGVEGIQLSAHGDGETFFEFQCFLLELQRRGILLAVCSKNNLETAWKPFREHPEMVLRPEHISVFMANWEDKAENIRRIREKLNIGFDSMVFLDDNPFERNLVRTLLPAVIVPELSEDPADYVRSLAELNLFETSSFSAEDARRTELYKQRSDQEEAASSFASVEEYLQSLNMEITVGRFETKKIPRIAQLFQRSNQFNLTTKRRGEAECEELSRNANCYPLYAELRDRLTNHGLISLVVAWQRERELFLSDWLMSCRVLTRGVEQFLMNHIVDYAIAVGCDIITAEYRPTAKNGMVEKFYEQLGFQCAGATGDGCTAWRLEVARYEPKPVFIRAAEPMAEAVNA